MSRPTIVNGTRIRVAVYPSSERLELKTVVFIAYSSERMMEVAEIVDNVPHTFYIPVDRLRQPDMYSHNDAAMYYRGPVCFRCSYPGSEECEDEVTGDVYDHHQDEPLGAGNPDYDAPTAEERAYAMSDGWVH